MEVESVNRKWSNEKLFGKESSNIVKLGLNRYDELMRAEISVLQHRHSVTWQWRVEGAGWTQAVRQKR